jgi:hypothetical protein
VPKKKKSQDNWFKATHKLGIVAITILSAVVFLLFSPRPTVSDNVAMEFGDYTTSLGFGNNYFAGACSEGEFTTRFYTMSGDSGELNRITMPIEVYDDPDATVVADIKICKAELGGSCAESETELKTDYDFTSEWGFQSGNKTIEIGVPFYVEAGSYYMITIEGTMDKPLVYSMYKAEVDGTTNRYFHTAPGCSSSRPDVYVVNFEVV